MGLLGRVVAGGPVGTGALGALRRRVARVDRGEERQVDQLTPLVQMRWRGLQDSGHQNGGAAMALGSIWKAARGEAPGTTP